MKFKGTPNEYQNIHKWVRRQLGTPLHCEHCGTTENRRYAWANVSGEYKRELNDWKRLCYPCHQALDGFGFNRHPNNECGKGHKLEGDNVKTRKTKYFSGRYCVECQRQHVRNHRERRRQVNGQTN